MRGDLGEDLAAVLSFGVSYELGYGVRIGKIAGGGWYATTNRDPRIVAVGWRCSVRLYAGQAATHSHSWCCVSTRAQCLEAGPNSSPRQPSGYGWHFGAPQVPQCWQELRAVDMLLGQVAEEFDGEAPSYPRCEERSTRPAMI